MKGKLCQMLMHGRLEGHRQDDHPARRPGLRTRSGADLRAEPAGLRSALPLPAGHRRGAERLCGAPGPARGRRRYLRGPDPDDPEDELGQLADVRHRRQGPGRDGLGRRRAASRLLGHRLHHLSRLATRSSNMFEEIVEMRREAAAVGIPDRDLVLSARRGDLARRARPRSTSAAYAAQIAALLGAHIIKIKLSTDHLEVPEAKKVFEEREDRHLDPGRAGGRMHAVGLRRTPDRRLLRRREEGRGFRSTTTRARSATAAATARSSAGTRSSASAPRRWRCSTSW